MKMMGFLSRFAASCRQWRIRNPLAFHAWIATIAAVVSCIAAIDSSILTHRALDFETRLRSIDDERAAESSRLAKRDAQFRAKLQTYANYSRGSMRTLRKLTTSLLSARDPAGVLKEPECYQLFKSYIYDAALGAVVGEYCVDQMTTPTADDLTLLHGIKTEFFRMQAHEFALLQAVGIPALAMADSVGEDAMRVYELSGPHMTIVPLPSTEVAMPLVQALRHAPRLPDGTMLQATGAQVGGGDRFQFAFPEDGRLATPVTPGTGASEFIGRVRMGVGMATRVMDVYFERKPSR